MAKLKIDKYRLLELTAPIFGFLASIVVLLVIAALVGESPGKAVAAILRFTVGTGARLATVFSVAIPLFLAGLLEYVRSLI